MNVLTNHNCLITGASRGLGAAVAIAFWKAGANLLLVARMAPGLAEVAHRLPCRDGQQVFTLAADLSDPAAPTRVFEEGQQVFDRLHGLVNNAAIQGPIGPVWENDWAEWQRTIQLNLLAPVTLCRLCVPWMAAGDDQRAKIINLSGGGATGPRSNVSAYATAKTGLVRFSETLAGEVSSMGIDVNCIAPGAMDTAMVTAILEAGPERAGSMEYHNALRVRESGGADPERAAALCVFLASSASDGVTGKLISAVWDAWASFPDHLDDLQATDVYTLRRIVPQERGLEWGE